MNDRYITREDMRNAYKTLVGKTDGKNPLEEIGMDSEVILKCILKRRGKLMMV